MASTESYFCDCNAAGILGTEVSETQAQLHVIYVFSHVKINKVMLKSSALFFFFLINTKMSKAFWLLILAI